MIDLEKTLEGGQCFGWRRTPEGYASVLGGRKVTVSCEQDIGEEGLGDYFDLSFPYEEAGAFLSSLSPVMAKAATYGRGLRILRQDPWVATVSFLLSQNNNIKRITSLYDTLCRRWGTKVEKGWYAFPTREQLSRATERELRDLHFGYRAPYIIEICRSYEEIPEKMPTEKARKELLGHLGIGPKVADCILLYGYHRMDVFPLDTWMKKVMKKYFPRSVGERRFKPYAALAQQYLFQAARDGVLPC